MWVVCSSDVQLLLFKRVAENSGKAFSPTKVSVANEGKENGTGKVRQHPSSERRCHRDRKPEYYLVVARVPHFLALSTDRS